MRELNGVFSKGKAFELKSKIEGSSPSLPTNGHFSSNNGDAMISSNEHEKAGKPINYFSVLPHITTMLD